MSKKLEAERNTDFYWWALNYDLITFDNYLCALDGFLSKGIQTSTDRIDQIQKLSIPIGEEGDDFWSNDFDLYNHLRDLQQYENFTNILLRSFVVSLYTYLESALLARCRIVEQQHNYRLSVKDLSGQGIQQAMSYLLKVHQFGYSLGTSKEWGQIQNLRILRNCIAHNGGRLDQGTDQIQKVRNYVSAEPLLNIDNNTDEIVVSREYCEKALLIVTEFLYAIDKALGKTNTSP